MSDTRPHARACGLYCRGHGTACSRDCPTCAGAATSPGEQTGPGWIMTTHGPVRRARPPWDIPAGPDGSAEPPGTVEALDAQIRRAEVMLDGLRRLRDQIAASPRR